MGVLLMHGYLGRLFHHELLAICRKAEDEKLYI